MNNNATGTTVPYDPNRMLDHVIAKLGVKSDRALSKAIDLSTPIISKIRNRRIEITGGIMIRIHEGSGISIRELRDVMGDRRTRFRITAASGWSDQKRAEFFSAMSTKED